MAARRLLDSWRIANNCRQRPTRTLFWLGRIAGPKRTTTARSSWFSLTRFARSGLASTRWKSKETDMGSTWVPVIEASTDAVPPAQRLEYWDAHNASELIGLR